MFLYNTLSEKKELVTKPKGKPLRLFVCGPTVYDATHLGHARTYLVFDIFVRFLRARGTNVEYLQNITDIDDKIIDRARREKKTPLAIARFFERAYHADMKSLGVESVSHYARATDFIPEIVAQVRILLKKGFAYLIPGDGYYFDVTKFKEYGKLSKRTALQAEDAVSRIDEGVGKRNKADFALWKFQKERGEPAWDTELGRGRPGWHIEDTAITESFFGPQYDIHGGALDLVFPHHEAEIAQQESASGKAPLARIWMHTGFLTIYGKKMSKSAGNFITVKEFLARYPASVLRFLVASHHYRTPIDFSWELAARAQTSLAHLETFSAKLEWLIEKRKTHPFKSAGNIRPIAHYRASFLKALEDDFNTPAALASLFSLVNDYHPRLFRLSQKEAKNLLKYLIEALSLLGIKLSTPPIPARVRLLARKRELSRINKQFAQADTLRNAIKRLGYGVEDTPLGPFLSPLSHATKTSQTPPTRP